MNRPRRLPTRVPVTVACALSLVACRSIPYDYGVSVNDPALAGTLQNEAPYPDQFEAVHRSILSSLGYQFDLMTYTVARRPGDLRIVATSGMGGTLYEITGTAQSDPRILQNGARLPKSWLTKGLYGDACLVCLGGALPTDSLVRHADGRYGLIRETGPSAISEYLFDPDSSHPREYLRVRRGRCTYRARFEDVGPVPGAASALPRRVTVENFRYGYRQTITLLELTAGPVDDALFELEESGE